MKTFLDYYNDNNILLITKIEILKGIHVNRTYVGFTWNYVCSPFKTIYFPTNKIISDKVDLKNNIFN